MISIRLPFPPLKAQIVTQVLNNVLELHDKYYYYLHEFYADEKNREDELMPPKKDVYCYYEEYARRDCIMSVKKEYSELNDAWKIIISCAGVSDDLYLFFELKEEVDKNFDLIFNWALNK